MAPRMNSGNPIRSDDQNWWEKCSMLSPDGHSPFDGDDDPAIDMKKYHRCFQKLLTRIALVKTIICAFCSFHLAAMITLDFLIIESRLFYQTDLNWEFWPTMIRTGSFGMNCLFLAMGITFGCAYKPESHRFRFSRRNVFYLNACLFLTIMVLDFFTVLLFPMNFIRPIGIIRSLVAGIAIIFLVYAMFDLKIEWLDWGPEARTSIQLYMMMFIMGILSSLAIYTYYFSGVYPIEPVTVLRTTVRSILMCRIFLSLNSVVWCYLIWYGVASINELNVIKEVKLKDFLAQYPIEEHDRQWLNLDYVALACQNEPELGPADEDVSIRTVCQWRKICFTTAATILFAISFYLAVSQLVSPTVWPARYYPVHFTAHQTFAVHVSMLVSVAITRLAVLMWPNIPATIIKCSGGSGKKCHRLTVTVYLVDIMAVLSQWFLFNHGFYVVLATNILLGMTISVILDQVCRLISRHMTIFSGLIEHTLPMALAYASLMAFTHYWFLEKMPIGRTYGVHCISLFNAGLALIIIGLVSRFRFPAIGYGFDLPKPMEMKELGSNDTLINLRLSWSSLHYSERKNTPASIVPYRLTFRLESMVSLLNINLYDR